MKKTILLALLSAVLVCGSGFAADISEIELMDGSVITAEIVSVKDGVFSAKSEALGVIDIYGTNIRSIRFIHGSAGGVQQLSPEDILLMAVHLQEDPDFQAFLKDDALAEALKTGDRNTLRANQAFLKLLTNPRVQAFLNLAEK